MYSDRIELEFRLGFRKIVIRKDNFVAVDVYRPPVFRTVLWALKLDLADLYEHVGIKRKHGLFKEVRFTPLDPNEFKEQVRIWASQ